MCKKNNINKMDPSQKFKYDLTLENLYLNKLNDKTVTSVKKKKKKTLVNTNNIHNFKKKNS